MVATRDIGRAAARLLAEGGIGERIIELSGPREYSPDDVATALGRAVERLSKPCEGATLGRTMATSLFATTCAHLGRADTALDLISEALSSIQQADERRLDPEFVVPICILADGEPAAKLAR